ncbi:MAG: response regulator transcription factor [Micrococcales bacterium]
MAKILVVEDEESYRLSLGSLLPKEGHTVIFAVDGNEALTRFAESNPDLILLDLMLPGISGNEVCKLIRQTSDVPIIMLTAKDSETDEVVGLEIGADDYVTKLASSSKLLARINKVLSRKGVAKAETVPDGLLVGGTVKMDVERHQVFVNGNKVSMPLKEFELLELLLENVDRVLTRGQIIDRVWGHDYFGDTKTLDVHIKRLRSKIEADPSRPVHLITVRGLGYKFES